MFLRLLTFKAMTGVGTDTGRGRGGFLFTSAMCACVCVCACISKIAFVRVHAGQSSCCGWYVSRQQCVCVCVCVCVQGHVRSSRDVLRTW